MYPVLDECPVFYQLLQKGKGSVFKLLDEMGAWLGNNEPELGEFSLPNCFEQHPLSESKTRKDDKMARPSAKDKTFSVPIDTAKKMLNGANALAEKGFTVSSLQYGVEGEVVSYAAHKNGKNHIITEELYDALCS